ncbi:kinase-like domain-containing protein [Gaertneriomyces semiglobifer]|nr:kinase-like domain-containing protein [Gaertneriomyces semiglobifer]
MAATVTAPVEQPVTANRADHVRNAASMSTAPVKGHAAGKPPVAPGGLVTTQANGRPGSCVPLPPRRNILYRLFHLGEHSDSEPKVGRSRRTYGSGSECESEGESAGDSDCEVAHRPRRRNTTVPEGTSKPDGPRRSITATSREAPRRLQIVSDSETASDLECHPSKQIARAAEPKRSNSKGSLFMDLLHIRPRSASGSGASPVTPGTPGCCSPSELSSDELGGKSSDSDLDSEYRAEHSSNLFKDLILHARSKKSYMVAEKPAEAAARPMSVNGLPSPPPEEQQPPVVQRTMSENSLAKYGSKQGILGKGANAVVRLCCPLNGSNKKLAVKEFRKRRKNETQKEYVKKLIAEFCISSTLHHENVVTTVDLIQDEKRQWCVVMEYCAGGDLYARISGGNLKNVDEVNCYFKQLVHGVQYLHSMGVAHRDLKPENLLLDSTGRILKITDFGVSEVFRSPFCQLSRKAKGLCGSGPYIAPEEFVTNEYDSELVDVWSVGIIYYVMIYNSIPWKAAAAGDPRYKHYLDHKGHFWPLDHLPTGPRKLMYKILEPKPTKRVPMKELVEDEWLASVQECHEGLKAEAFSHTHVCRCAAK